MKSHWHTSPWMGAAIGLGAAAVLAWLVRWSVQTLRSAVRSVNLAESEGTLVLAFWLLLALGTDLVVVVFAAQFHPLISAVPAAWFLVVFGPILFGMLGTPDWYPAFVSSYFLQAGGEAGLLVTAVLVAGTVAVYVRRRLPSPEPVADSAR